MAETTEDLEAIVGKMISAVAPMTKRHWDGSTVEYGTKLTFSDGSGVELYGWHAQDEGYLGAALIEAE